MSTIHGKYEYPFNVIRDMTVHEVAFGGQLSRQTRLRGVANMDTHKAEVVADNNAATVQDRIELRAEPARLDELKRDIAFARHAMYSIPPLSLERASEILDKLEQEHYYAPDVRMKLAELLSEDLGFKAPAEGESKSV